MSTIETAIENAVNPSSAVEQSRKNWEHKSPSEQVAGCRKALYGAVSPLLSEKLDPDAVGQIEGQFEAMFESYVQKTNRMSGTRSQS